MSIPQSVTIATIDDELPTIKAYANRHGWKSNWDSDNLRIVFDGQHPKDNMQLRIIANIEEYRALPPVWTFEDPLEIYKGPSFFPMAGAVAGKSSIFHGSNTICAPFNRLAYKEYKGPHGDWGGPANWLNAGNTSQVRATKIADMFAIILGHLKESQGMKK